MGHVVDIFIAPGAGAPMQAVGAARAVAGRGLEGDRYFLDAGSFSRWPGPHRELTLIAQEDLAAFHEATGVVLTPAESRRNVLTQGVDLEALVNQTFSIGSVRLRGMQRCLPCKYLARLTGKPVLPGLVRRGGLRARILTDGLLRAGDFFHV